MRRPALLMVTASLAGLLGGAAVPAAENLRALALPALFVQTMIAVGALAQARTRGPKRWAIRTLAVHHVGVSLPLVALGLALGLDTALGAGAYVLGAVPPAAGLPSYAASAGAQVRPVVRFCLLGYAFGLVATPALVLAGLGSGTTVRPIVLTLLFGLILPAALGTAAQPWLRRLPSRTSFGIVAVTVLTLTLSIGPNLRAAVATGLDSPPLLWGSLAVGLGRCLWGPALGLLTAQPGMRLESALAVTYRNAVLAAVIAYTALGPAAALPALLSLFGEAAVLAVASLYASRRPPGRTEGSTVPGPAGAAPLAVGGGREGGHQSGPQ